MEVELVAATVTDSAFHGHVGGFVAGLAVLGHRIEVGFDEVGKPTHAASGFRVLA